MNNFAALCGQSGATFLMRWRGRQAGPYSASAIEAKLAANEIGLLHEIFSDGKWITLRDYISAREAVLRAEVQAQEERKRSERQEAERQAKELENQRQAELAEAHRRKAQVETVQSIIQSSQANVPVDKGYSGLRTFGILLLVGGLAIAVYFFLAYDTSVESGYGRVNNLGLMADRQNGIIVGIGLALIGTIMLVIGSRGKN